MHDPFSISSRRVVLDDRLRPAVLLIRDGCIADILDPIRDVPAEIPHLDVGDRVLMPGLIDPHVHINQPGRSDWEGFETATQAAAAGGITTLVDMPLNSDPVTTTPAALHQKIAATSGLLTVDCGFHGGLVRAGYEQVEPLIESGVLGIKAFLIDSGIAEFPPAGESELRAVMPVLARYDVPLLVHAELLGPVQSYSERAAAEALRDNPRDYQAYLKSRPRAWERAAIRLMIQLCRELECRIHIVHLADADALPELHAAREEGLPITVETCPHYLCFAAEEIADGDTRFKCAPPIREEENRRRLWHGLSDGIIDFVASDHSPAPPALKRMEDGNFEKAWGGISSLQLGLSAIWSEARKHGLTPPELSRWMSAAPARLIGQADQRGQIAKGYRADLVVWDPEQSFTLDPDRLYHRHKMTPYEGRELWGTVETTFLAGEKIYDRRAGASPANDRRGSILLAK